MFHRPLLDVPDPFPFVFCSTPPPSTPTALPLTGIRRCPCATPHGGLLLCLQSDSTALTGCEPRTCIDIRLLSHLQRAQSIPVHAGENPTLHAGETPCQVKCNYEFGSVLCAQRVPNMKDVPSFVHLTNSTDKKIRDMLGPSHRW